MRVAWRQSLAGKTGGTTERSLRRNIFYDHPHSDVLVFFGATGDLAYRKIFPALRAMVKRRHLNVPLSAWPRLSGTSVNFARGRRTAWKNTEDSIPRRSKRCKACCATSMATITAKQTIKSHIVAQLAEDGDIVDDATVRWPEDRQQLTFGTISLNEIAANNAGEQQRIVFDLILEDGVDRAERSRG